MSNENYITQDMDYISLIKELTSVKTINNYKVYLKQLEKLYLNLGKDAEQENALEAFIEVFSLNFTFGITKS